MFLAYADGMYVGSFTVDPTTRKVETSDVEGIKVGMSMKDVFTFSVINKLELQDDSSEVSGGYNDYESGIVPTVDPWADSKGS